MNRSLPIPLSIPNSSRLMLFDMDLGGHHGNYIQLLIDRVCQQADPRAIDIVVSPQFLEIHRDTVAAIASYQHPEINIVPISSAAAAILADRHSGVSRVVRKFREWQIFCKYATDLQATHALMMYLDTCELPLAMGLHSPCPFAGIYFRPTFHYDLFANYRPTRKDRLQQWRERVTIDRLLHHPQLQTIFCLDPFAVEALATHQHHDKIVHLPDPVRSDSPSQQDLASWRAQLGIEAHRQVFLLFGALDGRKGIYQLLEAIKLLAPELCQQMCLLLVGKTSATEQANIHQKIVALHQNNTPIQVLECYDFIPDREVSSYFHIADVVLATYQRHIGMSGILLLAAAAGKPVLSSDYGLMGELVRLYQLGLAVDTTAPTEIAKALSRCLVDTPATLGDRSQMQIFVERNSIDRYASTIFQHLDRHIHRTSVKIGAI